MDLARHEPVAQRLLRKHRLGWAQVLSIILDPGDNISSQQVEVMLAIVKVLCPSVPKHSKIPRESANIDFRLQKIFCTCDKKV